MEGAPFGEPQLLTGPAPTHGLPEGDCPHPAPTRHDLGCPCLPPKGSPTRDKRRPAQLPVENVCSLSPLPLAPCSVTSTPEQATKKAVLLGAACSPLKTDGGDIGLLGLGQSGQGPECRGSGLREARATLGGPLGGRPRRPPQKTEPFPSPAGLKQAGTGSPCSSFSPLPGCRALPLPSLLSGDPEPFPEPPFQRGRLA